MPRPRLTEETILQTRWMRHHGIKDGDLEKANAAILRGAGPKYQPRPFGTRLGNLLREAGITVGRYLK